MTNQVACNHKIQTVTRSELGRRLSGIDLSIENFLSRIKSDCTLTVIISAIRLKSLPDEKRKLLHHEMMIRLSYDNDKIDRKKHIQFQKDIVVGKVL